MSLKTLFLTGLLLTSLSASAESRVVAVNSYAAAVNNRVITDGDVQIAVDPMMRHLQTQMSASDLSDQVPAIFESALNQLIDRALILEEFDALGYQLPSKSVLQEEQNFIQKNFEGDRVRFEDYLRKSGKTLEDWREELGDTVRIDMLRYREIYARIDISPLEVRRSYDRRKESLTTDDQVVIRLIEMGHGDDLAAARTKAINAATRAAAGEDFAELAKELSEGSRAAKGGEMPKMNPADLRTELSSAIQQLQVGEVTPVIETESKFYILKLVERERGQLRSFAEVREELERELKGLEAERLTKRWMERLRRKHTVHLF